MEVMSDVRCSMVSFITWGGHHVTAAQFNMEVLQIVSLWHHMVLFHIVAELCHLGVVKGDAVGMSCFTRALSLCATGFSACNLVFKSFSSSES